MKYYLGILFHDKYTFFLLTRNRVIFIKLVILQFCRFSGEFHGGDLLSDMIMNVYTTEQLDKVNFQMLTCSAIYLFF